MNEQDSKDRQVDEVIEPAGEAADESTAAAGAAADQPDTAADADAPDAGEAAAGQAVADESAAGEPAPGAAAEESAPDENAADEDAAAEGEPEPERDTSHMSWYVVHTYSGYENKARQALEERIKREKLEEDFGQILIPTEEVVEMSRGKRRTSKRKFFPGYMLVQMNMTEVTWYLVKSTPKITGFVGNSTKPQPVPEHEIRQITSQIAEGSERLKPKIVFEKGDAVRVIDGPFANFNGTIEDVDHEKGKLRVLVSIFGRATPVEMDFVQVEKT